MDEVDVKDFYFRQLRKVKVGDTGVPGNVRCSLLCCSNEFGLTFVGCSKGIHVFKTSVLYNIDADDSIGTTHAVADGSLLKSTLIPTPAPPTHVALSCDNITLSVCLQESGILKCYFYDIRSLSGKGASLTPFCSITLSSTAGVQLSCLHWNPHEYPEQLAVSTSDGTLLLLAVIDDVRVQQQKLNFHANAMCWSPKGKQLAVGLETGCILQLSPSKNFEQRKSYPCPDLFGGEAHRVTDLFWVATHVFAAIFTPVSPSNNSPSLVFMFTSKDQPPKFINCEDVYYGEGKKADKFYFTYISVWGVFISCSANAMETVVQAHERTNNTSWVQWELEDTGRAEFPLEGSVETYAAGMALDLTSKKLIEISETLILPPSPLLLLYSDHGVLCPYTVIYKNVSSIPLLAEMVRSPKPLPNSPRLVRQQKPGVQASPPSNRPALASSTPAASTVPPQAQPQPPSGVPGLMQQQYLKPGGSLGFTVAPTVTGPPSINQASPLASLGQSATLGKPPPFGPSSFMGSLTTGVALGGPGQPSSTASTLGLKPGLVSVPAGAQQAKQPTSTPLLGMSGLAGASQKPLNFPFSAGSLTPSSAMPSLSTAPPKQQQQQLPPSQPSTQTPMAATTIPSLSAGQTKQQQLSQPQLPPGYPSLQLKAPPTAPVVATPLSQQVPPGQVCSQQSAVLGGVAVSKMAAGSSGPGAPPRLSTPQLVSPAINLSTPAQPGQLSTKPLYSSTPLAHMGPLPQAQLGPRPPAAASTQAPLLRTALQGPAGPMAPPTRPPAVYSMAPRPQAPQQTVGPGGSPLSQKLPPSSGSPSSSSPSRPPVSGIATGVGPSQRSGPPPSAHATPAGGREVASSSLNQDRLESKFSNYIQKEIEGYIADLESLKEDMLDLFGDWEGVELDRSKFKSLGGMAELVNLQEETQLVDSDVSESVDTFKLFNTKSSQLFEDTLKVYAMQEEAKANLRKKMDPSYLALYKVRPLDQYSAQILNDLRDNFLKTEQAIGEVNSQLDAQLEKKYEEKRQAGRELLKVPSIQMVYSTLRDHKRITRIQTGNIDKLTKEMKQLKLIPHSWQPSDFTSPRAPKSPQSSTPSPRTPSRLPAEPGGGGKAGEGPGELGRRALNGDVMQTPVMDRMLNTERLAKLRESLSNITHTPVRTLRRDPTYTMEQLQKDRPSSRAETESLQPSLTGGDIPLESADHTQVAHTQVAHSQMDSMPASLRSSQTSLSSKPDVLLGGARGDISIRGQQGFHVMSLAQPFTSSRQSSIGIDAHVDPRGQIAIVTARGSQIQPDLSPEPPKPPQALPKSATGQVSPLSVARGPLQYGSPPFGTSGGGSAQPKTTTSPYTGGAMQVPTNISPNKGGTVSWGVPPAPSTMSSAAPPKLQTQPAAAPQSKPPAVGGATLSMAHSSSAPSLVKPPAGSVMVLPFPGQGPAAKNGLPQPFSQPSPFGGSTNPLVGELKRSEPVGDLTQIRTSAQKGQSPSGGGTTGSGLVGHQASSSSVPNVAITTASAPPFSLTSKFTPSLSTGPASSAAPGSPFSLGGLTIPTTTTTSSPPKPTPAPPTTSEPSVSFTIGSSTKPPTAASVVPPPPSLAPSTTPSSKPPFSFGAPGATPQFNFTLGSGTTPSFTAGLAHPSKSSATPTTSATPTSSTLASGSGSLFSMPAFSVGGSGSLFGGSTFPFTAQSSSSGGSSSSTTTASSTSTPAPSIFAVPGLGSGLTFPFSSQSLSLQTSSATSTSSSTVFTKPSPLTAPGSSVLQTTPTSAPTTSLGLSTAGGSGSGPVFGGSSMPFGLSSLMAKKTDIAPEPQGGEGGEGEGSSESEVSESSDDTNGGGGGQAPGGPPPKPQGGEAKQPSSTSPSTTFRSQLGVSLPSVSTEGGPKTIPQIGVPKSQPFGAAIQDGKTVPSAGSKPPGVSLAGGSGGGGGQGVEKSQQKTEVKFSPQVLVVGGESGTKTQADVKTTVPGVAVVKGAGEVRAGVTPQATVTTIPAPLPQPSQPAVTTAITTTAATAAIGKSTPSLDVSGTAPAATAGPKNVEQTVVKTVAPPVTSSTAATKASVNQPGVPASAATTAVTGLSLMGLQSREGTSTNQGGLLPTSDENNFTEGDMEGDMEDVDQLSVSDSAGLFMSGGGLSLGGLGGGPSNTTANPFGGGGGGGIAAATAMRGTGGGPFAGSTSSSGGGGGFLKPSPLGSGVISPPRFTTPSGGGLFSRLAQPPPSSSASSSSMGQGGFGGGPLFGSGAGLGVGGGGGLGVFGSPPQLGGQSGMGRVFGSVPGGSSAASSNSPFGGLASGGSSSGGGGGGGLSSFGSLAQQGQSGGGFGQPGQSSGFGSGPNTGGGNSFSQWRT